MSSQEAEISRPATHAELEAYNSRLLPQATADPAQSKLIHTIHNDLYRLAGTLELVDLGLGPTPKQRELLDRAYRNCASLCEKLDPLDAPPPAPDVSSSFHGHPDASVKTLIEFYSSLDKLERMSPMGARFLEAYAEK